MFFFRVHVMAFYILTTEFYGDVLGSGRVIPWTAHEACHRSVARSRSTLAGSGSMKYTVYVVIAHLLNNEVDVYAS